MMTYLLLLRGINVGGKNKVSMAGLKTCLEDLGCSNVSTFIASGNVILQSDQPPHALQRQVETILPERFALDTDLVKVLVLTRPQLQAIIDKKPEGFGEQPAKYHSDAIFLIGIDVAEALQVFSPRDGVDTVWPGDGVIYSQRLSAERTKSRLSKIMGATAYASMTIRSWNTTTTLLDLLRRVDAENEGE
jgi:uncharacterized protein (DUF1697 family)